MHVFSCTNVQFGINFLMYKVAVPLFPLLYVKVTNMYIHINAVATEDVLLIFSTYALWHFRITQL